DRAPGAGAGVPGDRGADIGPGRSAALTGIVQAPQGAEGGVIGCNRRVHLVVRLRDGDRTLRSQARDCLADGDLGWECDSVEAVSERLGADAVGVMTKAVAPFDQHVGGIVARVINGELTEIDQGGDLAAFEAFHGKGAAGPEWTGHPGSSSGADRSGDGGRSGGCGRTRWRTRPYLKDRAAQIVSSALMGMLSRCKKGVKSVRRGKGHLSVTLARLRDGGNGRGESSGRGDWKTGRRNTEKLDRRNERTVVSP